MVRVISLLSSSLVGQSLHNPSYPSSKSLEEVPLINRFIVTDKLLSCTDLDDSLVFLFSKERLER